MSSQSCRVAKGVKFLLACLLLLPSLLLSNALEAEAPTQASATPTPVVVERLPIPAEHYYTLLSENNFPTYLRAAFQQYQSGDFQRVIDSIDSLKPRNRAPAAPEKLYLLVGLCHERLAQHAAALESYADSLRLRGSAADTYFFMALSYLAESNLTSAISKLQDAIWFQRSEVVPLADINLFLGFALRLSGQTVPAQQALNTALQLNPALFQAHIELAEAALSSAQRQAAIVQARSAVATAPEDLYARLVLIEALLLNADRSLNRNEIAEAKKIAVGVWKEASLEPVLALRAQQDVAKANIAAGDYAAAQRVLSQKTKGSEAPQIAELKQQLDLEINGSASSSSVK